MGTVRVTLEAAGDLPEPVREALQALIAVATTHDVGVEFSHNSPGVSNEDLAKMTMTFVGR